MTPIGDHHAAAALQLPVTPQPRVAAAASDGQLSTSLQPKAFALRGSRRPVEELREQFTQFVGETFYGQMIKSMRSTVGKPAYFYGGRAEEVFQGQLDQKLAEYFTEASADKVAEPLFRRQFPHLVEQKATPDLGQLTQLPRR